MDIVIFIGSPRRKKSNSRLLAENFIKGFNSVDNTEVPLYYLADTKKTEEHKEIFEKAENVIIIFPLYTDSMPGIVKYFFETLHSEGTYENKNVGFIVQSGFPEAHHSVYLERYLKKFSQRMKFNYLGTVIKGGVEGIQIMPPNMTKKLFTAFEQLGEYFGKNRTFDNSIVEKLGKPYKLSKFRIVVFKLLQILGITNFYWNYNLKKNNAMEKSFNKPFQRELN